LRRMESWVGRPGIRPRCGSAVRLVESCRPPPRRAGPAHAARQNDVEKGMVAEVSNTAEKVGYWLILSWARRPMKAHFVV
jgi:hypothetical protein